MELLRISAGAIVSALTMPVFILANILELVIIMVFLVPAIFANKLWMKEDEFTEFLESLAEHRNFMG